MNPEALQFRRFAGLDLPLASAFYKQQGKRQLPRRGECVWTVSLAGQTLGALRLRPLPGGESLLTGLLVDPHWRCRGLAGALLQQAASDYSRGFTYLFCEPQYLPLYQRAGFVQTACDQMPEALVRHWQAYQRKTPALVAMCFR